VKNSEPLHKKMFTPSEAQPKKNPNVFALVTVRQYIINTGYLIFTTSPAIDIILSFGTQTFMAGKQLRLYSIAVATSNREWEWVWERPGGEGDVDLVLGEAQYHTWHMLRLSECVI